VIAECNQKNRVQVADKRKEMVYLNNEKKRVYHKREKERELGRLSHSSVDKMSRKSNLCVLH
jgi:hypothetical protein